MIYIDINDQIAINDVYNAHGQTDIAYSTASIPTFLARRSSYHIAIKDVASRAQDYVNNKFTISDRLVSELLDVYEILFNHAAEFRVLRGADALDGCADGFKEKINAEILAHIGFQNNPNPANLNDDFFLVSHPEHGPLCVLDSSSDGLLLTPAPGIEDRFIELLRGPNIRGTREQLHVHLTSRNDNFKAFMHAWTRDYGHMYLQDFANYLQSSQWSGYDAVAPVNEYNFAGNWFEKYIADRQSLYAVPDITLPNTLYKINGTEVAGSWIGNVEGGQLILPIPSSVWLNNPENVEITTEGDVCTINVDGVIQNYNILEAEIVTPQFAMSVFPAYQGADSYELYQNVKDEENQITFELLDNVYLDGNPVIVVQRGEEEIGCLIPNLIPESQNKGNIEISIDFGTSNTYVCFREGNIEGEDIIYDGNAQDFSFNDDTDPLSRVSVGIWTVDTRVPVIEKQIPVSSFSFPVATLLYSENFGTDEDIVRKPVLVSLLKAFNDSVISNIKWGASENINHYLKGIAKLIKARINHCFHITRIVCTYPSLYQDLPNHFSVIQDELGDVAIPLVGVPESTAPIALIHRLAGMPAQQAWVMNVDIGGGTVDYILSRGNDSYISSINFGADYIWKSKTIADLLKLYGRELENIRNSNAFTRAIDDIAPNKGKWTTAERAILFFGSTTQEDLEGLFEENHGIIKGIYYHLVATLSYSIHLIEKAIRDEFEFDQNSTIYLSFSGSGSKYLSILFDDKGNDTLQNLLGVWYSSFINQTLGFRPNINLDIAQIENPKTVTGQGALFYVDNNAALNVNVNHDILATDENAENDPNGYNAYRIDIVDDRVQLSDIYRMANNPNEFFENIALTISNRSFPYQDFRYGNHADSYVGYNQSLDQFGNYEVPTPILGCSQLLRNIGFTRVPRATFYETTNPSEVWKHIANLGEILK